MKPVHARRLLKLADYLEKLPRKQFNYSVWSEKNSCGTTACALGHACMMPEFRRLGASLAVDIQDGAYTLFRPTIKNREHNTDADEVAELLFGLTHEEKNALFMPGSTEWGYSGLAHEATPKQVAKHIRKFVKERTAQ